MSDESFDHTGWLSEMSRIVEEFEDEWHRGHRPELRRYLDQPELDQYPHDARKLRLELFRSLLRVDLEYRRRHGEHPVVGDYMPHFPEFEGQIGQEFSSLPTGNALIASRHRTDALPAPMSSRASSTHKKRNRLVRMGLLSESDWATALAAVAPATDFKSILRQLGQTRANWCRHTQESFPVLTKYQIDRILIGRVRELRLRNYVILEPLGQGGMGAVFKVRHVKVRSRLAALKTIVIESAADAEKVRELIMRLDKEVESLVRVRHPNLATVYEFNPDAHPPHLVMEYVAGGNLETAVQGQAGDGHGIEVARVVDWAIAITKGLEHIHARGIIHRDIKPKNIMLEKDGAVKLIDFGLAHLVGETTTTQDRLLGSAPYMPMEQWRNASKVSRASDMYSLGCTLYYVLTGQTPCAGNFYNQQHYHCSDGNPPRVRITRPDVPCNLDAIVYKLMAKQPVDRYQSATELLKDLCDARPPTRTTSSALAASTDRPSPIGPTADDERPRDEEGIIATFSIGPEARVVISRHEGLDRWPFRPRTTLRITSPQGAVECGHADFGNKLRPMLHDLAQSSSSPFTTDNSPISSPTDMRRYPIGGEVRLVLDAGGFRHLLMLDVCSTGIISCLCPSWFAPEPVLGPGITELPGLGSCYKTFTISGQVGREYLVAFLAHEPFPLDWLPTDQTIPAMVLTPVHVAQLLDELRGRAPGRWAAYATYLDVVT